MRIPAVKKSYNNQVVLDFPETGIPDGSCIAITGSNGSGKSTLAKILSGVLKSDNAGYLKLPLKVGYMSQYALAFQLSVRNNLMQNKDKRRSKEENEERAEMLMEKLQIKDLAKKNATKLSGGQMQKMSLARILMKDYDLLILDEPTASMDRETIPFAEELLKTYQKRTGCSIILITHSLEQAGRMADRIIHLEEGVPRPEL